MPYFRSVETGGPTPPPNQIPAKAATANIARPSPGRRRTTTANGNLSSLAPTANRNRRSNGADASATNGDAMEVDRHDGESTNGFRRQASLPNSAHRSPETEDQMPASAEPGNEMKMDIDDEIPAPPPFPTIPRPQTKGSSRGIQSEPVLRLDSTSMDLPSGKLVDRLACSPRDAAVLATAGPSLCRIWNCTSAANPGPNPFPCVEVAGDNQEGVYVSAMEWSPDGTLLARAIRDKHAVSKVGALSILDPQGQEFQELCDPNAVVLNLRWSPSATFLLAVTTTGESSRGLIHVWNMSGGQQDLCVENRVIDAVWLNEVQFTICGDGLVAKYTVADGSMQLLERYQGPDEPELWMHVVFDHITTLQAVIDDENGKLAVIDKDGRMTKQSAHDGAITAVEFQPIPKGSGHKMSARRILATASLDCTVRLWNAQKPTKPRTFYMSPKAPVLALSFSPDGSFVAAASSNHVQVWLASIEEQPVARWDATAEKDLDMSNGVNGHTEMNGNGVDGDSGYGDDADEPLSLLSWTADSSKLFFSAGNKVTLCLNLLESLKLTFEKLTMLVLRRHGK